MIEQIAQEAFNDELQKIAISAGKVSMAAVDRMEKVLKPSIKSSMLIGSMKKFAPALKSVRSSFVPGMDLESISKLQKIAPKGSRLSYKEFLELSKKNA